MITFALGTIYILGNLSVITYYLRERRDSFNWLTHGVFPIATSIAMIVLFYKSLNPFPPAPFKWGPIVVGVWAVLGIAVVAFLAATRQGEMAPGGRPSRGRSDPRQPEELAHRPLD